MPACTHLQAALAHARAERRVQCASLHVSPGNAAAVALYKSLGFEAEARVADYFRRGCDALRMSLDLEGG